MKVFLAGPDATADAASLTLASAFLAGAVPEKK